MYIFISSALTALIFWTASRGAIISLIISSIFIYFIYSFNKFNWRKMFLGGIIILIIMLLGFEMVPYSRKQAVSNRILATAIDQSNFFIKKNEPEDSVINKPNESQFIESRLFIWSFYLKYVLVNPLGIGPNTHMNFNLKDNNGEFINLGPHNTYLQILLWGGPLGLFSFLYILFSAFKNLKTKLQSNFDSTSLSLLGILFALSVAITFDDSLSLYWFFVVLVLSLKNTTTN
jgi:O-antigen ligase